MQMFFKRDEALVFSWRLSEPSEPKKSSLTPILRREPIGALLLDFLSTNFEEKESFEEFIKFWGFTGFVSNSITAEDIKDREYTEKEYHCILEIVRQEICEYVKSVQAVYEKTFYYCFDLDGPTWTAGLTSLQRYYIAVLSQKREGYKGFIEPRMLFGELNMMYYPESTNQQLDDYIKREAVNAPLEDIAKIVKTNDIGLTEMVTSDNIAAICYVEFKKMLEINSRLRKCANCNKYFIVTGRIDTKYCKRTDEHGRTCQEIGPIKKFYNKQNKDPLMELYRKTYKTLWTRTIASKKTGRRIDKSVLDDWRNKATLKMTEVKEGKISIKEFKEWLEKSREGLTNGIR
ncbi:MAG: DUF6076 domain-containing protein [Candidatus Pacebacteria bacterium]|nr:DUF6076 domain-containing protein [Candidatus Paceibacterota bacterium]